MSKKKSEALELDTESTTDIQSMKNNTIESVGIGFNDLLMSMGGEAEEQAEMLVDQANIPTYDIETCDKFLENSDLPMTEAGEQEPPAADAIQPDALSDMIDNMDETLSAKVEEVRTDLESTADLEAVAERPKTKRRQRKVSVEAPAPENEEIPETQGEHSRTESDMLTDTDALQQNTQQQAIHSNPVLTIEARADVETPEDQEEIIWHEIHNAYRTRRILTGTLGGIEQTEARKTLAIVDYKGFRVIIPIKEMMIILSRTPTGQEYTELMLRQNKVLGNMLGAEIDFVIKGIDSKTRSIVASRKDAILKKRQVFYMEPDATGMYRIYEGRIVQARVIAVSEKVVRVEAFGVECSILARDLAWDWIGDASERYAVGDHILIRVNKIQRDNLESIAIQADVKSVSSGNNFENLKKCRVQGKYAGRVTDVHKGVVFIRLSNGVNAIAHSCFDRRMPGKKDDVSFAVTHLDEDRGVAMGIITRIIKQNL